MAFNNFPYTDFHEINLDWIINKQRATAAEASEALNTANEANAKVDDFIENLDLQEEVNTKIDQMADSGELGQIISNYYEPLNDVIIVTHSYGTTSGDGEHTVDPFTNRVKGYIENNTGRVCYIAPKNGAGFEDGQLLASLRMIENTVAEPAKVGLILVAAGGNDAYEDIESIDIARGMADFTAYTKLQYPNAELRLMWIDWRLEPNVNRPFSLYNETIRRYKYLGDRHGFSWVTNGEYAFHQYYSTYYQPDGVHPTDAGETQLADYVMEAIGSGSVEVRRTETVTNAFTRAGSYPVLNCADLHIVQSNGTTIITPQNAPCEPTFSVGNISSSVIYSEFSSSDGTALATFEDSHLVKMNCGEPVIFPVTVVLTGDNHNTILAGTGKIQNERLYVKVFADDSYLGSASYSTMNFFLPEIVIPTMYC